VKPALIFAPIESAPAATPTVETQAESSTDSYNF
jgi:hypothetical protein